MGINFRNAYSFSFLRLVALSLTVCIMATETFAQSKPGETRVDLKVQLADPREVVLKGLLGAALEASRLGRLHHFIKDENSEPIALFSKEAIAKNYAGDWYGEHAGKWLVTAARAAKRTGDEELARRVRRVADYLISRQELSGYLGTYAPDSTSRMTAEQVNESRTWDVWVHAYLILGFLELNRYYPDPRYLAAACRIGDLCVGLFGSGKKSLANMGNHLGLSGTILLEPMVQLYRETGQDQYLQLAERIIQQMEERPGLQVVSRSLRGLDLEEIGDGKIYQLCWNYLGIAQLFEATGNRDYLRAVSHAWENIVEFHLTPGGGPWGGIAKHKEVFNSKGYFSPYGLVETCSTMSWIQLNRELLRITGEAKYADEVERSAYNSLLGAQDPNGEDWCYFIFPNGRRTSTYYWACCKSSGALALEELPGLVYGRMGNGLVVNLYEEGEFAGTLLSGGRVRLVQKTSYPFDPTVKLTVIPEKPGSFPLYLRIPSWADQATLSLNGKPVEVTITPGTFLELVRSWVKGDELVLTLPLRLRVLEKSTTLDHQGQEIFHLDYLALARGPVLYATGLIEGYKSEETLKVPKTRTVSWLSACPTPSGLRGPSFSLNLPGRDPIVFSPYYEAAGRGSGTWRLTWIPVAWQ